MDKARCSTGVAFFVATLSPLPRHLLGAFVLLRAGRYRLDGRRHRGRGGRVLDRGLQVGARAGVAGGGVRLRVLRHRSVPVGSMVSEWWGGATRPDEGVEKTAPPPPLAGQRGHPATGPRRLPPLATREQPAALVFDEWPRRGVSVRRCLGSSDIRLPPQPRGDLEHVGPTAPGRRTAALVRIRPAAVDNRLPRFPAGGVGTRQDRRCQDRTGTLRKVRRGVRRLDSASLANRPQNRPQSGRR
jgi:hypothetical protein